MSKPMITIVAKRSIHAPVEQVFRMYTDHAGWTDWAGFGTIALKTPGATDRNGVGAVRRLPTGIEEEIVVFERPTRMEYKIIKGTGIRNHHGTVTFTEIDGVTHIEWTVTFEPTIPFSSGALKSLLGWIFGKILARLDARLSS